MKYKIKIKNFSLLSRGLRWIKEIRKLDPIPLTIEEYSVFLFHFPKAKTIFPKLKENYSGKEAEKLERRIDRFYKTEDASWTLQHIGRSIVLYLLGDLGSSQYNWVPEYGVDQKYSRALEKSYEKINNIPKRYLYDSVGCGMTGIAFEYPGEKIEKISYSGFSRADLVFFGYLKKNPLKIFPRIYDYSEDQVIMEKLKTDSPKLEKYKGLIKKYRITNKDFSKRVDWEKVNEELGENHEFTKFLRECEDGLYKIFGIRDIGDLTTSNIAQRSNGDIVYMDPVGPWIS